jgi:hypothetical protein
MAVRVAGYERFDAQARGGQCGNSRGGANIAHFNLGRLTFVLVPRRDEMRPPEIRAYGAREVEAASQSAYGRGNAENLGRDSTRATG